MGIGQIYYKHSAVLKDEKRAGGRDARWITVIWERASRREAYLIVSTFSYNLYYVK